MPRAPASDRRARLSRILDLLADGRQWRAQDLAAALGVTPRTIWRDMDHLRGSGVAITGTRGAGYQLAPETTLPPLTLSAEEMEALNLGLAIVEQAADPGLRDAAARLGDKIDAVLAPQAQARAEAWRAALSPYADPTRNLAHLPVLRSAIKARQKLLLTHTSATGEITRRTVRPLHLSYFGRVWQLTAWCELRADFRRFRLDQIESIDPLSELFMDSPGKRLADLPDGF